MSSVVSQLPPPPPSSPQAALQFEVYRRNSREVLRAVLVTVTDRFAQACQLAQRVSFIPKNSVSNKLPFHREALEHPQLAAKLSYKQERAVRLHAACLAHPPNISAIRSRPKRARDAFGPGMLFVVNTVLAWLMFSIDALEGSCVVVELRYDTIVRGQLVSADEQLNMMLSDASMQPLQGPKREASFIYLKGRHVRFIHLPGNLDPAAAIDQHRKRVAQAVRQHTQQQLQAAGRLQKGSQLQFGQAEGGGGGGTGAADAGAADMDTD